MSLFKRGKTWWIDFTTPGGKRIKRSAKTKVKREAQEYHDKLRQQGWEESRLGIMSSKTWDEAAFKWVQTTEGTANYSHNLQKLSWLQDYFGGMLLTEITRELIKEVIGLVYEKNSAATANRYIAVVSSTLKTAVKDEWLVKAPHIQRYKEDKKRVRWIKVEEYWHLLTFLPDYLKPMVQLSISTGLRQSNVKLLEWTEVDFAQRKIFIPPEKSKSGEQITVPLNKDALRVLMQARGNDPTYVFIRNGKPIMSPNNRDWRKALVQAEIENFRWHDLRHTWASWHVQNGTSIYVLKELGGWKTLLMVEKYAHFDSTHLEQYVGNVLVGEGPHGTNTVQAA